MNWVWLPSGKLINLDAVAEVGPGHECWYLLLTGELRTLAPADFGALRWAVRRYKIPVATDPPAMLQSEE